MSIDKVASREFYLDNLKVALTILVIFFHAGVPYGDDANWIYHPSLSADHIVWMQSFITTFASFSMGLFFFIAGYFTPSSYDRQGFGKFAWRKSLRLGIPFLFILGSFSALSGHLEFGHGWFVENLLLFVLLYGLLRLLFLRHIPKYEAVKLRFWMVLALAGVVGAVTLALYRLLGLHGGEEWIEPLGMIKISQSHIPQYVGLFLGGLLAFRFSLLRNISAKLGWTIFAIGFLLCLGIFFRNVAWVGMVQWKFWPLYEPTLAVFFGIGLIYVFQRLGNATSTLLTFMAANAYGAYILHLFFLLPLQFGFDKIDFGSIYAKYIVIGGLCCVASFGATSLLKRIPGVRRVL